MTWLTPPQIATLLAACDAFGNRDLTRVVKVCLATGARWREAENLQRTQLSANKITFVKTKGGKNRTVPIPQWLYDELAPLQGQMFQPCYPAFSKMLAATDIALAEGQKTHVLRHTFAAHFMTNGGNILVLQRILGHANIRETLRYAHFAPDHLEEAVTLNPLAHFNGGGSCITLQFIAVKGGVMHWWVTIVGAVWGGGGKSVLTSFFRSLFEGRQRSFCRFGKKLTFW